MTVCGDMDMDVRFYYYRDEKKRPLVTLCKVKHDDGRIGYGWAVCSASDNCHKRDLYGYEQGPEACKVAFGGKSIALGRAEAALRRGKPLDDHVWCYKRTIQRDEALAVLWQCRAYAIVALEARGDYTLLPRSMQPYQSREGDKNAAS